MSDKPIHAEIVQADDIKAGEKYAILTTGRAPLIEKDGVVPLWTRGAENEPGWVPKMIVARILPDPVEVREFWRVTRTSPAGEEWIDDLIDRESAVREAREYLKAWKDRPGHTATIENVIETIMSREEVKP